MGPLGPRGADGKVVGQAGPGPLEGTSISETTPLPRTTSAIRARATRQPAATCSTPHWPGSRCRVSNASSSTRWSTSSSRTTTNAPGRSRTG